MSHKKSSVKGKDFTEKMSSLTAQEMPSSQIESVVFSIVNFLISTVCEQKQDHSRAKKGGMEIGAYGPSGINKGYSVQKSFI